MEKLSPSRSSRRAASGLPAIAPERVARGTPLGLQVLVHIQIAGHSIAGYLAGECERERVAMLFTVTAGHTHRVAGDRAVQIPGNEIALVVPFDPPGILLEEEPMIGGAAGEFDVHVPLAGEVRYRWLCVFHQRGLRGR